MSTLLARRDRDNRAAAVSLAEQSYAIFPCKPGGKAPVGYLAPHGFKDATNDPGVVDGWWSVDPRFNIGLVTGKINGLAVVDVDHDADAEEDDYPPTWNQTRSINTPHGAHFPHAIDGPQRSYREVAGIGLKADGGYVIAPPSFAELPYELVRDRPLAPLPTEWLARFTPAKVIKTLSPPVRDRVERRGLVGGKVVHIRSTILGYVNAALRNEYDYVLAAPVGQRNTELNVAGFALGQLVDTGWLPETTVYARLSDAARRAGLEERETRATIRSGINAGSYFPRTFS